MTQFNLTSEKQFKTPGDAAVFYKSLGWEPIVLPAREKAPKGKWGTVVERTDEELFFAYGAVSNVGIALGERSSGLIDIDNDWSEAALVGKLVFSAYPSFGRATSQNSHRFVRGVLPKNRQYKIPPDMSDVFGADKDTVLELRGNKMQTMVPPSVHPNGELLRWHDDPRNIPEVEGAELERYAGCVAFLSVVLKRYPRGTGNRDNICLALTGALVRAGFADEEIDAWVMHVASLAGDDEAEKRGGKAAASREKFEAGEETWGLPTLCEFLGIEPMEKTLRKWLSDDGDGVDPNAIVVRPGELPQAVDRAEQALIDNNVDIFQRFESLVRVARIQTSAESDGIKRETGALVLQTVTSPWLREQFARHARWARKQKKKFVPIDPPSEAATAYLARVGNWRLRFLKGVIQAPTLRPDGSVLQDKGYDPDTGLLYDPGRTEFARIPDNPTKEEARAALEVLKRPFREVRFGGEPHRSVALAAVMTALVRRMFPSAPLIALDAPTAGSGKSLLSEIVCIIATGHKPAMMSQGKSDEENEKRLSSVLMAGDPVIVIDNCDRPIEGDFLCTMLTQEKVRPRILGRSEVANVPTGSLVIATGNNIELAGDITRRTLFCRIDTGEERPDKIEYSFDAIAETTETRPQLVVAALTILRAYIVAGRPKPLKKIGGFEQWGLIREALVWLDQPDPELTRELVMADDPHKALLVDFLRLWRDVFQDRQLSLSEVGHIASDEGHEGAQAIINELIANTNGRVFNTRSAGKFLRKHMGRVAGGMILKAETDSSGIKHYRVLESGRRQEEPESSEGVPF
ncbi:bifunctional DNA primase/polymerase [Pelagibacterium limicola]|uniref:bifunctional DNA primase/polymerase n=1 Tax=Pelagibacterium limicola TaxID=2791022 RepID=UPI0018B012BF|nr:bifunctional DNA primase/polymerase [Pelagibacterium limicola]